uniref:Uncharacterized protein n=1 Tax=Candidozyma auris TaxID=498019 RepID=A0A0L0NYE1_CANAR
MPLEEDMLVFLCVHFSAIELFVYEKNHHSITLIKRFVWCQFMILLSLGKSPSFLQPCGASLNNYKIQSGIKNQNLVVAKIIQIRQRLFFSTFLKV